jgi:hypothetical protein
MEDISPSDIALDSGYYQLTTDRLFWVLLTIGLLCVVTWALRGRR